MAYGLSNGHVTYDVTWPQKVLWGSTVGYPSDSLASYLLLVKRTDKFLTKFSTKQWHDAFVDMAFLFLVLYYVYVMSFMIFLSSCITSVFGE